MCQTEYCLITLHYITFVKNFCKLRLNKQINVSKIVNIFFKYYLLRLMLILRVYIVIVVVTYEGENIT